MNQSTGESRVVDRPMPAFAFHGMTALLGIRDRFRPRGVLLDEIPLKTGGTVLDYGCGPGSYIPELAARVGQNGLVVAVDIHPLAIQKVQVLAGRKGLRNVKPYLCDGLHLPDLNDGSVDVVLLFDIFHMLGDQVGVLRELHRVLRPDGMLAVNDHHMDQDVLPAHVARSGHFRLTGRGEYNFTFAPVSASADTGVV